MFHTSGQKVAKAYEAHEFHFLRLILLQPQGVLHFEIPGRRWHFTRDTYTTGQGTDSPTGEVMVLVHK
jgi:hypothetical protein